MRFPGLATSHLLLLLSSIIILVSCKKNDGTSALSDAEVIISCMNDTRQQMQAPGWIAGIYSPHQKQEHAGGMANLETQSMMVSSDLIRIGSISKTFTATLVLILCDESVLHLNDKLESYYPGFPNADKITIRHLLMHRAGIVTWDEDEEIRLQIFNNTGDWTIDKLIDWAAQKDPISEPGAAFHYSNIGYFLLGKILEQATNKTVAELLQSRICQPLGLNHTFMPASPHPAGETIHGYDGSGGSIEDMTGTPQADAINYELAWTAGGILSSLDDLRVWAGALCSGELLSDSLHMAQMPVLDPPGPGVPYWSGYGMGISQTDAWMGHTGAISGFICYMQHYPGKDVTIITFFNKFSAFDAEVNAADLSAAGQNFMKLAKYICPETLQP